MARRRRSRGRNVNGVFLLDKPTGMTSNAALQVVKGIFKAAKAGHTGSLDPLASGLLPICLGEATKFSSFLLDSDKRYDVVIQLGVTTATGDAEGEETGRRDVPALDDDLIESVLAKFRGEIQQIPPMYSALKHNGQRLYDLARQGVEVEREPRTLTIHELTLNGFTEDTLDVSVHCTKGTYVRVLAEDIGEALGCGAHVTVLRRTGVGGYDGETMIPLADLEAQADAKFADMDQMLLPLDTALQQWPEVQLNADSTFYIRQGQPVLVPKAPTEGWVRMYGPDDVFLGAGEIEDNGQVAPRRLLNTSK